MNTIFKATIVCTALTLVLSGCSGRNTETATYDVDGNPKTSSFGSIGNFKIDMSDIPTYEAKDIEFDFKVSEFDSNIFSNIPAYTYDASKIENMTIEQKELILETKEALLKDMVAVFADNNIQANVDSVSGEVTMDASILFDVDKSEISDNGKEFLKKFIPAYTSVICDEKYNDFISEILIEGHTDTNGTYDYNKKLSQDRANNVSAFCMSPEINIADDARSKFQNLVSAVGNSYDNPIKDENGNIDMEASRRVTFRFMINLD